jgi:hypothetical protein
MFLSDVNHSIAATRAAQAATQPSDRAGTLGDQTQAGGDEDERQPSGPSTPSGRLAGKVRLGLPYLARHDQGMGPADRGGYRALVFEKRCQREWQDSSGDREAPEG